MCGHQSVHYRRQWLRVSMVLGSTPHIFTDAKIPDILNDILSVFLLSGFRHAHTVIKLFTSLEFFCRANRFLPAET
jgi:hypothetical protein